MRNGVETIATVNGAVKPVFALLDIVHKFLSQQSDNFIEEIDVLLEPSNTETIVIRQRMALEQGLLDVILDIIEHCGARVYDKLKPRVDRARGNVDASSVVNQKMHHKNIGLLQIIDFLCC